MEQIEKLITAEIINTLTYHSPWEASSLTPPFLPGNVYKTHTYSCCALVIQFL